MKFEQPPASQESPEEQKKKMFIAALNEKLAEMQESGQLSPEQVEEKKIAVSKIETGLSDDPKSDAELFAISGIAEEAEMIDVLERHNRKEDE